MAYLVTNPRRSSLRRRSLRHRLVHNGAINMLIYKHLGLSGKVNSDENRDKIVAFKKTKGYDAWKAKIPSAAMASTKSSMKSVRDDLVAARRSKAAARAAEKAMKASAPKASKKSKKSKSEFDAQAEAMMALIGSKNNPRRKHRKAKMKAKHLRKNRKHSRKHFLKIRKNFGGAFTSGVRNVLSSDLTIGTVGGFALAGVAHFFLVPKVSDVIDMLGEKVSFVQPVTNAVTTYAPYSATGLIGGLLAGGVASMLGRPQLGLSLGTALFGVGVSVDTFSFFQNRAEASAEVPSMGNVAYGRTLRDAYGNVAYGGTVVTDFGGTVVTDFGAASMADAAVCGDDFAAEEGQALLDGPAAMAALAGPLPVASGARSGAYSRFAGRRMARWYWLVKCVGLQRAQQIAALSPEKRVKLLTDLRKQALASLDAALTDQSAAYGSMFESDKQQYGAFVYAGAGY
jgi:hypothetical protein